MDNISSPPPENTSHELIPNDVPKKKNKTILLAVILFVILASGLVYSLEREQTTPSTQPLAPTQPQIAVSATPSVQQVPDADYLKLEKELKNFLQKSLILTGASYVAIPGTDLEIQIPSSYKPQPVVEDNMLADTNLLNYKSELPSSLQSLLDFPGRWWGDFRVGVIQTSLTPQEWVLDNVVQQGVKLRDQEPTSSRGTTIIINGKEFFIINTGCCGTAYYVYMLPYIDTNNQKSILVFTTHNRIGQVDDKAQKNIVLDTLLTTLRKK